MPKKSKKHNPRSEAAQRFAVKSFMAGDAFMEENRAKLYPSVNIHVVGGSNELLATFDLRDCYRKRAPLKGIKKAMTKAIQPKRKK